jgi:hypothetical protein
LLCRLLSHFVFLVLLPFPLLLLPLAFSTLSDLRSLTLTWTSPTGCPNT